MTQARNFFAVALFSLQWKCWIQIIPAVPPNLTWVYFLSQFMFCLLLFNSEAYNFLELPSPRQLLLWYSEWIRKKLKEIHAIHRVLWFLTQFLLKETLVVRDGNCREDTDMIWAMVFLSQLLRINTPHSPLHGNGPLGLHLGLSALFSTLPLPENSVLPTSGSPGPKWLNHQQLHPLEFLLTFLTPPPIL